MFLFHRKQKKSDNWLMWSHDAEPSLYLRLQSEESSVHLLIQVRSKAFFRYSFDSFPKLKLLFFVFLFFLDSCPKLMSRDSLATLTVKLFLSGHLACHLQPPPATTHHQPHPPASDHGGSTWWTRRVMAKKTALSFNIPQSVYRYVVAVGVLRNWH